MKTELYTIYDKVSKSHSRPMAIVNKAKAIQVLQTMVNDEKQGDLAKWPEQYSLYYIGNLDDNTGILEPLAEPEFVANGQQVVDEKNKQFTLQELFDMYEKYQNTKVVKLMEKN